jgi:hypothetical protein
MTQPASTPITDPDLACRSPSNRLSRLMRPVLPLCAALALCGCEGSNANSLGPPKSNISSGLAGNGINSVDTIEADMRLLNDLALAGVPTSAGWATGPGHVVMGNDPRGSRTPAWWQPGDVRFKSDAWWTAMVPWLVVFDGVGHAAVDTRVQVRGMKVYVLSRRTGRWSLLAADRGIQGALYSKTLEGQPLGKADLRAESDGSTSIGVPGGNQVFHGWCCGRSVIDAPDVGAVFITLQARLLPGRTDDRASARLLLQVGGDYYPDSVTNGSAFAPAGSNPGIGVSRAKLLVSDWQAFNFATINAGVQDPGGASISVAVLRTLPPPLD